MKIVIPGGTGQVGRMLARHFLEQGAQVTTLNREMQNLPAKLEGADVCINLMGRSVNCRYNASNRKAIYESRVDTTRRLHEVLAGLKDPPRVWLNASTATIYRHALDRPMNERTGELGGNEPGAPDTWNFSIQVAKAWEQAFFSPATPRTRKVALRSAITMSPDPGGAFEVLLGLVRRGLGGTMGSGDQFVSWIHEFDFVRAVDLLIAREDFEGVVNIAAPHPLPNRDFMRSLRDAQGVAFGLPAPRWAIELGAALMRTESELVLKSRRVIPGRLLEAGFKFEFPNWRAAARELVSRWRENQDY
jgi:uncharacterized protein (TIGR01777 family)